MLVLNGDEQLETYSIVPIGKSYSKVIKKRSVQKLIFEREENEVY